MSQGQLVNLEPQAVAEEANKFGLIETAKKLKTSRSSLSRWLNEHGYFAKPQYMKVVEQPQQHNQVN